LVDYLALCWADGRDVHWAVMWVASMAFLWADHWAELMAGRMADLKETCWAGMLVLKKVVLMAGRWAIHWAVTKGAGSVDWTAVERAAMKVDRSVDSLESCLVARTAVQKDTKMAAHWVDDLALCWADWKDVYWAVMWVAGMAVQ
jgi:hypothetical protein